MRKDHKMASVNAEEGASNTEFVDTGEPKKSLNEFQQKMELLDEEFKRIRVPYTPRDLRWLACIAATLKLRREFGVLGRSDEQ
jgi:hypothetical protein